MTTAMSDEEYWERAALAALTGLCANPRCWEEKNNSETAVLSGQYADKMVAERSARHKKQHGIQEE